MEGADPRAGVDLARPSAQFRPALFLTFILGEAVEGDAHQVPPWAVPHGTDVGH